MKNLLIVIPLILSVSCSSYNVVRVPEGFARVDVDKFGTVVKQKTCKPGTSICLEDLTPENRERDNKFWEICQNFFEKRHNLRTREGRRYCSCVVDHELKYMKRNGEDFSKWTYMMFLDFQDKLFTWYKDIPIEAANGWGRRNAEVRYTQDKVLAVQGACIEYAKSQRTDEIHDASLIEKE